MDYTLHHLNAPGHREIARLLVQRGAECFVSTTKYFWYFQK